MNLETYRQEIKRTLPNLGSKENDILHMKMGIITELSEILDIFKKEFAYGKEVDIIHLKEELGDLCWYLCNFANIMNFDIKFPGDINYLKVNKIKTIFELFDMFFSEIEALNEYTIEDFLYDILVICNTHELSIEDVMQSNINKLRVRFPDKFDSEKAINRNLESEYNSLT